MRLSSLNIISNMRITQPNAPDMQQSADFEFELTKSAVVSDDFYELVFYELLNGYATGVDTSFDCGFKFIVYDDNDSVILETTVEKLDKYLTEAKKVFEVTNEYTLPDATVDVFIKKVDVQFVANKNNTATTYTVFESTAPQQCAFAEDIDPNDTTKGKAVKLVGGEDSKIEFNFKMEL